MTARTRALTDHGVSIWLDDLSRDRIVSGGLATLIAHDDVVGITTNPTIFANALGGTSAYDTQLRNLAAAGSSVEEAVFELTTDDIVAAADILLPIHTRTAGHDGWVSIEVSASVAHDAAATIDEARRLAEKIGRPNVFVKIPAVSNGLAAITASIAAGISVNVTLIFGLDRYRAVVDAYLAGLEGAQEAGRDLAGIRSVASLFVSRLDTAVDAELERIGTASALDLRGRAGVASARLAYEIFENAFAGDRARRLLGAGGHVQRPLWASTGVKDPRLPDTHYVVELVARNVVTTMPEKTLRAVADHARLRGDTVSGSYDGARRVLDDLAHLGIRLDDVTDSLERDGLARFARSGDDLLATVDAALERLR